MSRLTVFLIRVGGLMILSLTQTWAICLFVAVVLAGTWDNKES